MDSNYARWIHFQSNHEHVHVEGKCKMHHFSTSTAYKLINLRLNYQWKVFADVCYFPAKWMKSLGVFYVVELYHFVCLFVFSLRTNSSGKEQSLHVQRVGTTFGLLLVFSDWISHHHQQIHLQVWRTTMNTPSQGTCAVLYSETWDKMHRSQWGRHAAGPGKDMKPWGSQ